MDLPKEPTILLSYVNTKLRDEFSSLQKFCEDYNIKKEEIEEKLNSIDYYYCPNENQFK